MPRFRSLKAILAVAGAVFGSSLVAPPVAADPDEPCVEALWQWCIRQHNPVGSPAWQQCVDDNYYMFCPLRSASVTRQDMIVLLGIRED